jgi:peptide-methionine (S)-S-oxide reductase
MTSVQYRSAIFYHNDQQKEVVEKYIAAWEAKRKKTVRTAIEPYKKFWLAEDYHQKYQLQQNRFLLKSLGKFPSLQQFVDSYHGKIQ